MTLAHSPKYNAKGTIELVWNHPEFGEIPFCASPDDSEAHGRDIYAAAVHGDFGPVAPYVAPVKTQAQLLAEAKVLRNAQVAAIKVTVSSGKVFDGDEVSQDRMARAVAAGDPGQTTQWKLADNTAAVVTYAELREALRLAGQAQTAIWMS